MDTAVVTVYTVNFDLQSGNKSTSTYIQLSAMPPNGQLTNYRQALLQGTRAIPDQPPYLQLDKWKCQCGHSFE
jgi:hypothetical protein